MHGRRACVAGDVCGRGVFGGGCAWLGCVCGREVMHGGGHAWQGACIRGMHGGGMHGEGSMCGRRDSPCSGRYAS